MFKNRRLRRYEIQAALLVDSISKEPTRWATVAYRARERSAWRVYWRNVNREHRVPLVYRIYDCVKDEVL